MDEPGASNLKLTRKLRIFHFLNKIKLKKKNLENSQNTKIFCSESEAITQAPPPPPPLSPSPPLPSEIVPSPPEMEKDTKQHLLIPKIGAIRNGNDLRKSTENNLTSDKSTSSSSQQNSYSDDVAEGKQLEPDGCSNKNNARRAGKFFTFSMVGKEEEAMKMADKNDEKSPEERMAEFIGPKAEKDEKQRKREIERRLKRPEVLMRKKRSELQTKPLPMELTHSPATSCNSERQNLSETLIYPEHKQQRNLQLMLETITAISAEQRDEQQRQFATAHQQNQKEEKIVIPWRLVPVDGIPTPLSMRDRIDGLQKKFFHRHKRATRNLQFEREQNMAQEEGSSGSGQGMMEERDQHGQKQLDGTEHKENSMMNEMEVGCAAEEMEEGELQDQQEEEEPTMEDCMTMETKEEEEREEHIITKGVEEKDAGKLENQDETEPVQPKEEMAKEVEDGRDEEMEEGEIREQEEWPKQEDNVTEKELMEEQREEQIMLNGKEQEEKEINIMRHVGKMMEDATLEEGELHEQTTTLDGMEEGSTIEEHMTTKEMEDFPYILPQTPPRPRVKRRHRQDMTADISLRKKRRSQAEVPITSTMMKMADGNEVETITIDDENSI